MAIETGVSGLRGITAMLVVKNLEESIRFYTEILGFDCEGVWPEDGEACWASLINGRSHLMLSTGVGDQAGEVPALTGSLYFYPPDVDAAWEALKDKVEVEYPIETFEYGMREFGIRDCNGYLLQYGQGTDELEDREADSG